MAQEKGADFGSQVHCMKWGREILYLELKQDWDAWRKPGSSP